MSSTLSALQRAFDLHRSGHFAEAIGTYREIVAEEPHNAEARHLWGLAAHQTGDHLGAVEHITQAVQLNASRADFYANLAAAQWALGNQDAAWTALRAAARLEPDNARFQQDLGIMAIKLAQWSDAVAAFRTVVQMQPGYAPAHNNLGHALVQLDDREAALACFREAVQLQPRSAELRTNLADTLQSLGQLPAAVEQYREVVRLTPDFATGFYNLAIALKASGHVNEAIQAYQSALLLQPDFLPAQLNLANILLDRGRLVEAADALEHVALSHDAPLETHQRLADCLWTSLGQRDRALTSYRRAAELQPETIVPQLRLAMALRELGHLAEAADVCQRALTLDAENAEAQLSMALVLHDQGNGAEAISMLHTALQLKPDWATAHNALGAAWERLGDFGQAAACLREALRLQPDLVEAHNNLGSIYLAWGKSAEALQCFDAALARREAKAIPATPSSSHAFKHGQHVQDPGQAQWASIHRNRGFALLTRGDFAEGWAEAEWRLKMANAIALPPRGQLWDGRPLEGRNLLVVIEQGLGDVLQFIRYAKLASQRGARILVACQAKLVPLLRTCPYIADFAVSGQIAPPFDFYVPLLSLPKIFGTDLDSIPAEIPYLAAEADRAGHWRDYLAERPGVRVGIAWQGNPIFRQDRDRSIPLSQFAPLAAVPGVRLLSLQQGFGSEQREQVSFAVEDIAALCDEESAAFCETAAVMKNLDLVITSDTSIAHLAGALGVPVWVALGAAPDWRWLLEREDSPWYPTMRLFRQRTFGDWSDVFQRLAQELANLASSKLAADHPT